jgi:DNA-binding response OmpR family regulator
MHLREGEKGLSRARRVLIIDDDRDITDLVHAILTDEGFAVSTLHDQRPDAIRAAVNQLEPDCVLLDGESPKGYGDSWGHAVWMRSRQRRVPLIMFSGHRREAEEAQVRESRRSRDADFFGVITKPFDLDALVQAVSNAVGNAETFEHTPQAERERTAAMMSRLTAAGAQEIHVSTRREWATFETVDGTIVQLYWWERDGVYYVVKYAPTGGRLETVGRFYDLDPAIVAATSLRSDGVRNDGQYGDGPANNSSDGIRSDDRATA